MNAVHMQAVSQDAPDEVQLTPALQGENLSYIHAQGQAPVFESLNLQVQPREIVGLLGGSGCGKSTLLRVLSGLARPTSGHVQFMGEALLKPHPRAALVFQQASLLPWLHVAGNVGFGLDFKHQPDLSAAVRAERVAEAIEAVGLTAHQKAYPRALSGGMAQRVALARALARQPQMLFADEPFSALDAITRAEMQALLVSLVHRWHTAALLVTHDIDEAILVADRIVLMGAQPGRLIREWVVDIPRPRESHPAQTTALRLDILDALRDGRRQGSATGALAPVN